MNRPSVVARRARGVAAGLTAACLALIPACSRKAAADADVWAEVDGKVIRRQLVERYYRTRMTAGSDASSPEQALSFKLNILNELINNEILVARASRAGITVSEAEVDTKVAELQSPYSKQEFEQKLKDQGMSAGDLRQEIRQNIIITKLINKDIVASISVSDADIREYYDRNQASFNVPELQYHLAQIEVTPVDDPEVRNLKNDDAKTPQAAQRKIQALYARLQSGEEFGTVAQEYSEDPRTASGGGDMGFIPISVLDANPTLKQAVASLNVGQMSGILRSQSGFHILKLLGREQPGQREVTDPQVQSAIRRTLMNEKEQLLKAAYIESLRNAVQVTNYLADRIVAAGGDPAARP
ncbi:MAG: peptidylprolyl isomerase [Acidobacteria bacterium]|nr:peptidylprolyl isomerase [Acidobacteriota bacterium]